MGLLGLIAWIIPLVGVVVAIIGIVFSTKNIQRTKSAIAICLCIMSLVASGINAYIGAKNGYEAGQAIEQQYYSN